MGAVAFPGVGRVPRLGVAVGVVLDGAVAAPVAVVVRRARLHGLVSGCCRIVKGKGDRRLAGRGVAAAVVVVVGGGGGGGGGGSTWVGVSVRFSFPRQLRLLHRQGGHERGFGCQTSSPC